jgi:hypothetical protein
MSVLGMRTARRRRLRRWRPLFRRRRPLPALILPLALLVPAAPASAAARWEAPRTLSVGRSAPLSLAATAAIDRAGNSVVLWHSRAGVEAVVRPSGHGFGAPRAIRGSRLSMPDLRPRLAFDPRGAAVAVWSYFDPHPRFVEDGYAVDYTFGLRVAARDPHGAFGSAQTLTGKLDADPSADVTFDASGNAVVVWTDQAGMHAAARPKGKRRFDRARVISTTQADPQVTASAHGSLAAWTSGREGAWTVRAAADEGDGFGRAAALSIPGLRGAKPALAVDGRSAVTAAWVRDGRVMAATCSASGHCRRTRTLSRRGETATDPHVAVAADGSAVVAWQSQDGIAATLRSGHGAFRPAADLTKLKDGATATSLTVGMGPRGDAAALWTVHADAGDQVVAAMRHGRSRFSHAYSLTAKVPGAAWSDPQVVLGESGQALAIWGALTDGHPAIQAAMYGSGTTATTAISY